MVSNETFNNIHKQQRRKNRKERKLPKAAERKS